MVFEPASPLENSIRKLPWALTAEFHKARLVTDPASIVAVPLIDSASGIPANCGSEGAVAGADVHQQIGPDTLTGIWRAEETCSRRTPSSPAWDTERRRAGAVGAAPLM